MTTLVSRRTLLKGGLAVGAGLAVGFPVVRAARGVARAESPGVFAPNQWLRIDRDGVVTIVNSVPEMGQGSLTTTPMIIADELDVVLDQVRVEQAPANPGLYKNPVTGNQSYGGSRGVRDHLAMWRKAAAAAREMLMQAAASEWAVPVESVETEPGAVVHRPTGRRLLYGQLVDRAQALPVPQDPKLKTPDKFRYIGKHVHRRDTPEKIYVQHRIWEKRADIVAWLDGGANFYVCGDMNAMAKDVRTTLVRAYADVNALSPEAAEATVASLERDKRYQQDVY